MPNGTARPCARRYLREVVPSPWKRRPSRIFSEGTVPSYAPAARIGCPYCGLISDGSLSHGRIGDCVERAPVRGHAAERARASGPTWRSRTSSWIGSARWRRSRLGVRLSGNRVGVVAGAAAPIAGSRRRRCGHRAEPYRAPDALRLEIVQVWSHSRQRQNDVTVMTLASVSMILPLQNGHAVGFAAGSLNGDSRIRPGSSPTRECRTDGVCPRMLRLLDRAAVQE